MIGKKFPEIGSFTFHISGINNLKTLNKHMCILNSELDSAKNDTLYCHENIKNLDTELTTARSSCRDNESILYSELDSAKKDTLHCREDIENLDTEFTTAKTKWRKDKRILNSKRRKQRNKCRENMIENNKAERTLQGEIKTYRLNMIENNKHERTLQGEINTV